MLNLIGKIYWVIVIISGVLIFSKLVSCGEHEIKTSKYTVWVGQSAFASGYCIDGYSQSGGFIKFIKLPSNKEMIVPLTSVLSIENDCEYRVRIDNE